METFRDELEILDIQMNNTRKDVWDFLDKIKQLEERLNTLEKKQKKELLNKLKCFFKKIFSKLKIKHNEKSD